MSIDEFKTPFQIRINMGSSWKKLASTFPRDALTNTYYHYMNGGQDEPSIDARIVIGVMIIKHKLNLDNWETIEMTRENIPIPYFLGLEEYTYKDVFDKSLFTKLGFRLGTEKLDAIGI